MSGVSEKSHNIMQSWGMELNDANGFRLWDDTDAAIEFCENTLLLDVATETGHSWDPSHAVESQDIFFLETGRLGVFIAAEGDQKKRVRSMVDGAIIGELAFYSRRSQRLPRPTRLCMPRCRLCWARPWLRRFCA